MAKADRTGKRKTRDSFPKRTPDLGHYFIVTDTEETEENYLYGLRDSLPLELRSRIVIQVSQVPTNRLVRECLEKAALDPQYAQPWIVFDRDRVKNFDKIISQAETFGIHIGWSNPCIEIWFDAYFGKIHSYSDSVTCCRKFADTFKTKTEQEYKKSNRQIYALLCQYGDETKAIQIAEHRLTACLLNNTKPSEMVPCTTLHRLVGEIRQKAAVQTKPTP